MRLTVIYWKNLYYEIRNTATPFGRNFGCKVLVFLCGTKDAANITTYEERVLIMNEEKTVLPTNVRQIGSISGERIYMEDYACTYLQQYAACEPTKEKAALLVGKHCEADGEKVLFISGVIQGKYTVRRGGFTEITEKTWQYVKKQLKLYFEGLEVVGWAYIQPGFEDYLSEGIPEYQRKNADRGLDVLFLSDPLEKLNSFFKWDKESASFSTVRGYLVYYEKNEGMHEYMLENKLKAIVKEDTATAEVQSGDRVAGAVRASGIGNKRRVMAEQRRLSNLLGSVSFVMLLVCFVMGAGLIRSDRRINGLESRINLMQSDINGTKSVFASQSAPVTASESTSEPYTAQAQSTTAAAVPVQSEAEPTYKSYTVEAGDTILKICKNEYGNDSRADEIMELNDIKDPSKLYVGMELRLPRE
jgi:LysM repeat protein